MTAFGFSNSRSWRPLRGRKVARSDSNSHSADDRPAYNAGVAGAALGKDTAPDSLAQDNIMNTVRHSYYSSAAERGRSPSPSAERCHLTCDAWQPSYDFRPPAFGQPDWKADIGKAGDRTACPGRQRPGRLRDRKAKELSFVLAMDQRQLTIQRETTVAR